MKDYKIRLLLDSGIFSAWSRGEKLSLREYIAYLKDHEQYLWGYVGKDSIPGKYGEKRTLRQVEKSAERTYKNQQIMRDAGLRPIPVFHQGESFKYLERYLRDGEKHIGISSAKDLLPGENARWLDEVFTLLTTKDGRPIVRTHGFGITKPAFLIRYPFYSVDSTTWSLNAGYGRIIVPTMGSKGIPDFTRPNSIHISGVKSARQFFNNKDKFQAKGDIGQRWIIEYLQSAGLPLTRIRYFSDFRRAAILHYYLNLCKQLVDVRFGNHGKTLAEQFKPIPPHPLYMMFSTMVANIAFSNLLTDAGANDRLLSYYELRKRSTEQLVEYVTTGKVLLKKSRRATVKRDSETYKNRRRLDILARAERV